MLKVHKYLRKDNAMNSEFQNKFPKKPSKSSKYFSKNAKNTRISENAKIWISFKELEWPRNFEINFKKILNMFFQKTPKIPENSFFFSQNTKKMEYCELT